MGFNPNQPGDSKGREERRALAKAILDRRAAKKLRRETPYGLSKRADGTWGPNKSSAKADHLLRTTAQAEAKARDALR